MIIGQHRPHSNGDYLVAESGASRDVAVITGGNYGPGAVLGRVSATGALTAFDPTAADGSETAVAILFATAAAAAQPVKAAVTARAAEVNGLALAWRDGVTADRGCRRPTRGSGYQGEVVMQAPVRIRDGLRVFVDRADALTPEQALRLTEHLTLRAMLRQAAEMPARRVQALRMRRVGSGPAK